MSAITSKAPGPKRGVSWTIVAAAFVLIGGGVYGLRRASHAESSARPTERPAVTTTTKPTRATPAPTSTRDPAERTGPRDVPLPSLNDVPRDGDVRTARAPTTEPVAVEPRAFTEADAKAAMRDVRIDMYATTWCGSCRRAREYLDYNGIQYTEYDIDADADVKSRLSGLNPRGSIPTFEIDGIVQVGFSPANFEHRLNQAVRARSLSPSG